MVKTNNPKEGGAQMSLYAGMDLHSSNTYLGIMDDKFKRVFSKRLRNDISLIIASLEPFREELEGIVVESTYNWYWLVDGLMDVGFGDMHLANPCAIKQYEGLKYTDDRHDAFWLAHLLVLGILPEGYIYPVEDRPVRDLLRKRSFLVRKRTSHIHSLRCMIERHTSERLSSNEIKKLEVPDLEIFFQDEHLNLSAEVNVAAISFLTHHITRIQKAVKKKVKLREPFELLKTVPGIGEILALTIMLEVGDISRFSKVGDFASYARCVPTKRISNEKSKGKGNRKNGNRYLNWAFVEASNFARRFNEKFLRYSQRKTAKTNYIVATKAICNKLARVCYYIMRDQVPFREEDIFC
jgi:transposase